MPVHVIDSNLLERTEWAAEHFAWALVDEPRCSVKLEEIPVGGASEEHFHKISSQLFLVLSGQATMVVGQESTSLKPLQAIEIQPGQPHRIVNEGKMSLRFLLVSYPAVDENDIFRK